MRGDLPAGDGEPGLERPNPSPERGKTSGPSARTLLIAAILMVGLCYFLSVKLREMARIQDCAMSGRTNCVPVDTDK
jgi:hypothetical protein